MGNTVGKTINCALYTISDDINDTNSSHIASINAVNRVHSSKIDLTGDRGELAGYESAKTLSGNQTIGITSPDTIVMNTSGAITLTFVPADVNDSAVKVISLKATGTTTLTVSGAEWANAGEAPTWGTTGKYLVLVANFIGGRVIINVFDNNE